MRFYKLLLILFCLIPITTYARDWPKINRINVDKMEKDLIKHPNEVDEHRHNYKKEKPDAKLSVEYEDEILWISKRQFSVVKIVQLNGPNGPVEVEPFEHPISDKASEPYRHGLWHVVKSGRPRKDLVFAEEGTGKRTRQENYYKVTFSVDGKIVDPHIIIRP